jgi:hypothetical protein
MAQPEVTNATPFAMKELYLGDEEGRELLAVLVKGTYAIGEGGRLALAEEQQPVNPAGVYYGDPATSSARFEPEVAPLKLATDVVLVGHAHAGARPVGQLDVGLQVGTVSKVVRVFGDRRWYRSVGVADISPPERFELMPLVYERAFGGWDRTSTDPADHTVEGRNPVGVGYHHPRRGVFVEGMPLPNLELPRSPIAGYSDAPPPAGFGFVGPGWQPRVALAGTYDEAWTNDRMPLLPKDFDRRFYNAAPADQTVQGYLRGDEAVRIANASPEGRLEFALPAEPPPTCTLALRGTPPSTRGTALDTVIFDTDARQVVLLWRTHFPIPGRLYDVREIRVAPHPSSRHAAAPAAAASAR